MRLRRSLVVVVTGYGYFLIAFALWRRGDELPGMTKLIALAGFVLAIVGTFLARQEIGLWVLVSSLTFVTVYFVADPYVQIAWMQLSVLVAIICLALAFLSRESNRFILYFSISILSLFNFLSYLLEATSLLRSGSFLGRGSISSLMIFTTSLYAVYGWHRMIKRAKVNDEKMSKLHSEINMLEKSQESQRYWRELVIRVHETTLNTIRSMITLKDVPIENLRGEIEASLNQGNSLMSRAQERRSGSVIGAIRAGIDNAALQEKVKIISQGVNLHLDSQVANVVERVIREALRNATEHAGARNIEIMWRTSVQQNVTPGERERGRVAITITDDGVRPTKQFQGGIGTNLVMSKSIDELGGTFELQVRNDDAKTGTVVRIEVPTFLPAQQMDKKLFPAFSAVDLGRYMALLTLFGPAMTGVFFFPILGIWWPGQLLTQLLGLFSLLYLLYTTFIRVKRLGWVESAALAIGLLGIIYFLELEPLDCVAAQPFQWVINSVVYGLFIILLWGKWQVTALAYPVFLYLVAPYHDLIPQQCNFIFNFPILNTFLSFLFVAVIFLLVYKTFERVEKFQELREHKNLKLVTEIERNDAAFERILQLDASAKQTIRELLGNSGVLTSQNFHALRMVDSELRSEIQVDPVSSAGLTLLASDFVQEAVRLNRWLEVRSIHGDEDTKIFPPIFTEKFLRIAGDIPNGTAIQVVTGDGRAELSIHVFAEVSDSAISLKKFADAIKDDDLSVSIQRQGPQEYVLFIRRGKLSQ